MNLGCNIPNYLIKFEITHYLFHFVKVASFKRVDTSMYSYMLLKRPSLLLCDFIGFGDRNCFFFFL